MTRFNFLLCLLFLETFALQFEDCIHLPLTLSSLLNLLLRLLVSEADVGCAVIADDHVGVAECKACLYIGDFHPLVEREAYLLGASYLRLPISVDRILFIKALQHLLQDGASFLLHVDRVCESDHKLAQRLSLRELLLDRHLF